MDVSEGVNELGIFLTGMWSAFLIVLSVWEIDAHQTSGIYICFVFATLTTFCLGAYVQDKTK